MSEILGIGSRVKHPSYGEGAIIGVDIAAYKVCFMQYGLKHVGKEFSGWEIIEALEHESTESFTQAEKSLTKILKTWMGLTEHVNLGDKWDNGTMSLQPGDSNLKSKEIPIDIFFHKIVMVRDRLRVMEQRINSSGLTDEEKVNLQQYITRIYGSLTSFNVLFKYKEDHFKGS
ncbi:MAG: hypothetical protein V3V14_01145 [Saprospiraceae bacterium]